MMYANQDYDIDHVEHSTIVCRKPLITVENCEDKGYTVVNLSCVDRHKLVYNTVCTLTDMQYVVFYAIIISEGPNAHQEYYIRHVDGCKISSEVERQHVNDCLETAIKRQISEVMTKLKVLVNLKEMARGLSCPGHDYKLQWRKQI
ncbi:ACT domain-containing protein ACR3 [Abeliophyllum distichum]|uniref:ACT domain-containing protein ACR n=1 Tax=Abeliophyllum distichum TaxID=126358 RepID=A0ABD1W082_9LAMI